MKIHKDKSDLAGKRVRIKAMDELVIEDWWDRLVQKSWMDMTGNPACLEYAVRTAIIDIGVPLDNEVLYGHTVKDNLGHLIHISEILDDKKE